MVYNGLPQFFEKEPDYRKNWADSILEGTLPKKIAQRDEYVDYGKWVTKSFSVAKGKENTAIAGFSMGGREALYIGIMHPEQFGYVGAVCPAPGLIPETDKEQHPGQLSPEELKYDEDGDIPYLIYLAGAKEDAAVGDTPAQIHNLLERNSVNHIWQLFDGTGHDESSVEIYLYNYLQMLLK